MILRINDTDYAIATPESGWFSLCVLYRDGEVLAYVDGEEVNVT